jgi:hypothetical protein
MGRPSTMGALSTSALPGHPGGKAGVHGLGHHKPGLNNAHPTQGQTSEPQNAVPAIPSFKELDKNGDGRIERSEAADNKELLRQFGKWDSNDDGEIELNEYHDMEVKLGSLRYPGRVTNTNPAGANSGTTNHASTMANPASMGYPHTSTAASVQGHISTMGKANTMGKSSTANAALRTPRGHRGLGAKRANPSGKTTAPSNAVPAMCSFSSLDTNHNGMISHKEAKANRNLYRNFRKWDRNGDGKIEHSEWQRMQVKLGSPKYPGRATNTHPYPCQPH